MQAVGQSPMAQQMQAAIMAHIAQHIGFNYRAKVEQQLGVPLPPPDSELTPEVETQLSRLVAKASQQLLQVNTTNAQQQAQQQQAQQAQQDPRIQIQMQELQIKMAEEKRKQVESDRNFQLAQQKLNLEQGRIASETQKEGARIAAQTEQGDKRIRADMMRSSMQAQKSDTPNMNGEQ